MRKRRILSSAVASIAFLIAVILYTAMRGMLTRNGLIIGLLAAIAIFAAMQTNRGPYI
jgi:xanthine/uracil permease